jgi:HrpA-like RNA helicase
MPLYGAMALADQDAVIRPAGENLRKIVLATTIAETSLTIDGIDMVIDSGLKRSPRFDPATGMTELATVRVSQASVDQRRGRAGRQGPGLCLRLWPEQEMRALKAHDEPEILIADLSPLVLELANWGVADRTALRFLDPPPEAAFAQARDVLAELDARQAKVAVHVAEAGETEAEAHVAVLRARLPQIRSQAHRTREAANAGAATGQSADETTTALAVLEAEIAAADAAVKVARAHVEQARAELDAQKIAAPVPGRIVRRAVRVGDVVSPQSTEVLFEILPERPRIVRAELNESYVDKVRPGMEAEVVRDNDSGLAVRARVLRVGDVFGPSRLADDPEERAGSRDVECVLALEGGDFRIGQRVLVRFRR